MKQITPYSDLEFAILTEDDSYKSSEDPRVSNYFRNLAHYINFKVICLGETPIPVSLYGIDLDSLINVAVNFDLGGKTPLGRSDKDYSLICTPYEMHLYMTGDYEVTDESRRDPKLSFILENTSHIVTVDTDNETCVEPGTSTIVD